MYTPKLDNEEDFYNLECLSQDIPWLVDAHYEKRIYSLWNEFRLEGERKVIKTLLTRLIHHEQRDRFVSLDYLSNVISELGITADSTIFVATSDGNEVDGSTKGLYDFKAELASYEENWKENNFLPSIEQSYDVIHRGRVKNVVIFDDFIGTGKTIVEKVNQLKSEIKRRKISGVNYYIFAYVGLEFGVEYVEKELSMNINCHVKLKKGISDFPDSDEIKKIVIEMESKLKNKWNKMELYSFSLGYDGSEALYQLYRSHCSNNVLPIFWWKYNSSGDFRQPLFNRLR
ncbi:phosphoribosyltransferase-like protein [Aliivibrio wodanis]|uniref:phosphoribosyltransferase-like protein n=1 Tax=Aliivibrio wodanis TaxID=80852 RepID=UPI00406D4E5E